MWMIRQNPYSKTDSQSMVDFICKHNIVTCPFAHNYEYSSLVDEQKFSQPINGWSANSQDKAFLEKISVGDLVVIPFIKLNKIIIARVTSTPHRPKFFPDLVTVKDSRGKIISLVSSDKTESLNCKDNSIIESTFYPIYREIEILKIVDYKSFIYRFPINSISRIVSGMSEIASLV